MSWLLALLLPLSALGPAVRADDPALVPARPTVWLAEGTRLWSRPGAEGTSLARLDALTELPVLEQRGDWVRVRFGSVTGWVPLPDAAAPSAELPLVPRAADPGRLAAAKQLLGSAEAIPGRGSLPLYTDVDSPALIGRLRALLDALPDAYLDRFDLDASGPPIEAVVLFRRDEDLLRFLATPGEVHPYLDAGLTRDGMAITAVGARDTDTVARNLVHEAVHLLNRRAFSLPPPIWLEEGMANDLAFCRFDGRGHLLLGTLGGTARDVGTEARYREGGYLELDERIERRGPIAALAELRADLRPGDLDGLFAEDRDSFFAEAGRQQRYALATFLVRYLLDAAPEPQRSAFLRYLGALSRSDEPRPDLFDLLELGPGELESGFTAWLGTLPVEG